MIREVGAAGESAGNVLHSARQSLGGGEEEAQGTFWDELERGLGGPPSDRSEVGAGVGASTQGPEGDASREAASTAPGSPGPIRDTGRRGNDAAHDMFQWGVDTARDTAEWGRETLVGGVEYLQSLPAEEFKRRQAAERQRREDLAADPENQERLRELTAKIPSQDIIYEQLAHNLAYGHGDLSQLREWGYDAPEVAIPYEPLTGMYAVAVTPRKDLDDDEREAIRQMHGKDLHPVIAFRGSEDAIDWADDLSPEYVGVFQFTVHKQDIGAALSKFGADGTPDTTGHSLGGALAQLAATVGAVHRVVTFQAPGIAASMVEQVPKEVKATHHRAANDFVAWAGVSHLAGDTYGHQTTKDSLYDIGENNISHTHFLLGGLNDLRGGDVPNIYDGTVFDGDKKVGTEEGIAPLVGLNAESVSTFEGAHARGEVSQLIGVTGASPDWSGSGEEDWYERYYEQSRRVTSEGVRYGLGTGGRMGDRLSGAANELTGLELDGGTEAIGRAGNHATGGEDMQVSGDLMQRYQELARKYKMIAIGLAAAERAAGEPVDLDGVRQQIEAEEGLGSVLIDKLKRLVRWTVESRGEAVP